MAFALAASLTNLGAESVTLSYAPGDGAVFDVSESVERVTVRGESDPVTDLKERLSQIRVQRTETGYSNTATIQSVTLTRNGHPVASPVYASMENLALTHSLGSDGSLVEIGGYEGLTEAMSAKLPAALSTTIGQLVNLESLRRQDEAAHRQIFGSLIGSTFEVGVAKVSGARHDLPYGGSVPVFAVEVLELPAEEGEAPRLTRHFSTDATALAAQFEAVDEAALLAAAGELAPSLPESHASASVSGITDTRFDFEGMLVESQTTTRTYVLSLNQAEGDPLPVTIRETQSFSAAPVPETAPQ